MQANLSLDMISPIPHLRHCSGGFVQELHNAIEVGCPAGVVAVVVAPTTDDAQCGTLWHSLYRQSTGSAPNNNNNNNNNSGCNLGRFQRISSPPPGWSRKENSRKYQSVLARLERPAIYFKGFLYWCSASMLFYCMTVCRRLTARTDDRTHLSQFRLPWERSTEGLK